ncbi:hypothetical protein [Sphingosinicella microcystinivorans]|uniref:hypothetical protein n=1 Tax=Sphingosinicella microcystinivorans TaxID=335406 RepID=UPI0022F3DAA4|nr:hypothetical protein [Sphingosinicella microcystinivorans]WBX82645.1 hypothetical protein PE061_12500 [Sphingosinicella microcystinivorans]
MGREAWQVRWALLAGLAGALLGVLATATVLGGERFRRQTAEASDVAYVPVQRMTLPVMGAGGPQGYVVVEFALEVPRARRAWVRERVPEVRHAVNAAAWRSGLAAASDDRFDIDGMRAVLLVAAQSALGPGNIRQVRILTAVPV